MADDALGRRAPRLSVLRPVSEARSAPEVGPTRRCAARLLLTFQRMRIPGRIDFGLYERLRCP